MSDGIFSHLILTKEALGSCNIINFGNASLPFKETLLTQVYSSKLRHPKRSKGKLEVPSKGNQLSQPSDVPSSLKHLVLPLSKVAGCL